MTYLVLDFQISRQFSRYKRFSVKTYLFSGLASENSRNIPKSEHFFKKQYVLSLYKNPNRNSKFNLEIGEKNSQSFSRKIFENVINRKIFKSPQKRRKRPLKTLQEYPCTKFQLIRETRLAVSCNCRSQTADFQGGEGRNEVLSLFKKNTIFLENLIMKI